MAKLTVALGEYDTGWHSPESSLKEAEIVIECAAAGRARLVVLPEMATTGFTMDTSRAVTRDSADVDQLRELAREYDIWLIAGVALREPASDGSMRTVNAAFVIEPSGEVKAIHRKQRLFAFAGEHQHYSAGDTSTVVEIEGVRVATFVCYDLRFPELFGAAATAADVMVIIANWPASRRAHWDTLLRARAIENQCAVIGVNRTGVAGGLVYDGGSQAYDAWGEGLHADVGSGTAIVTVDSAAVADVRAKYPFLRDRGR